MQDQLAQETWERERVGRPLWGRTYRKDFMSKPRFRICPTTWSQLPGLERLRPPAARYLELAEVACRAGPRPWVRGLAPGAAATWACSWPRLWLVVGWLGCRPRWCWLRGCCRLCCRVRVRGRWHLGSPVELGIDSRVVAVDRVESSKLGVDGGEERKEKRLKGSERRRKKPRARRPQCRAPAGPDLLPSSQPGWLAGTHTPCLDPISTWLCGEGGLLRIGGCSLTGDSGLPLPQIRRKRRLRAVQTWPSNTWLEGSSGSCALVPGQERTRLPGLGSHPWFAGAAPCQGRDQEKSMQEPQPPVLAPQPCSDREWVTPLSSMHP